jgi:hypothetical protein
MTTKTKPKYTITNKKPCEVCHAQIKATKDNNLCAPCTERVKLFDHLWRVSHEQETVE